MKFIALILMFTLFGCAEGDTPSSVERTIRIVRVNFEQTIVVRSSVFSFDFEGTESRQANFGVVRFEGSIGEGRPLIEEYVVPVGRNSDGNLQTKLRVVDGLWDRVAPEGATTFTGLIEIELHDEIGIFAVGDVTTSRLEFRPKMSPQVDTMESDITIFPNEELPITGSGFLRPEEGTTWAVVTNGRIQFEDNSERPVNNARVKLLWDGDRNSARFQFHPSIFGVRISTFSGDLRFENELRTSETFEGNNQTGFSANLRATRIDSVLPTSGSRGQKVFVNGRGFLRQEAEFNIGTFLVFEGTFTPDNPNIPPVLFEGPTAFVRVPWNVVSEKEIEQDVWYDVDSNERTITGLGATPGLFDGMVQPTIYKGDEEQRGEASPLVFRVLPTKQVVHLKYLPGFSKALEVYGLGLVEQQVRDRIRFVLERDYKGVHVEFTEVEPKDYIEYTTLEIGGTDPSGLLNFGYDNSFNDGGKDIGNLYLSDYLGGVNRHSQDAGYLPFGGVFIESFIAFSPSLYPDNFGTSDSFDRMLTPFMEALGGSPVTSDEFPNGPRDAAVRNAIDLIANLTGHTASHEIGHSLGLAFFPPSVEGFEERFHNDPPGENFIMDAGSDRPFDERAQINGRGPANFGAESIDYLRIILPTP